LHCSILEMTKVWTHFYLHFLDLKYPSYIEETRFRFFGETDRDRERETDRQTDRIIDENTKFSKVSENIDRLNGSQWGMIEDSLSAGMSAMGLRWQLKQISSTLEALRFRCINAHHVWIEEKQVDKRDLAL